VFTARYALSPYIKQIRFVFKGLNQAGHQLRTVVAVVTGHAPVKKHLNIMALFGGDTNCRFCRMEPETAYSIVCCCETLAYQRYDFCGKFYVETKDISTASLKYLCPCVKDTGLMSLCRGNLTELHSNPKAEAHPEIRLTNPSGRRSRTR
jgi:hypothetical protein